MSRASGLRAASVSPVSEKRVVPCLRLREVHLPILLAFACKVTAQLLQRAAHPLLRCLFADAEGGGGFAMAFLIEESKQQGIALSLAQAFERFINDGRNLLFLTKDEPTKEIWYYEHPYPPGVKSYNKGKPIRVEEFDAEKKWWSKPGKRKENEFAWGVAIEEIVARGYNLDVKNPHTVDDAHRDPAELLAEYPKAQAAVAEVREKLRKELETALTRQTPTNIDRHGLGQTGKPSVAQSVKVRERPCAPVPSSAQLVANAALSLLNLACYLLNRQIAAQEKAFLEEGGFTERLYRVRMQARNRPPAKAR